MISLALLLYPGLGLALQAPKFVIFFVSANSGGVIWFYNRLKIKLTKKKEA